MKRAPRYRHFWVKVKTKSVFVLLLTAVFSVISFAGAAAPGAAPLDDCKEYSAYGVPGNTGDMLCRKGFLLAHDPVRKTPAWVIEHLTRSKALGTLGRKNIFAPDPSLPAGHRAELSDYKGSGYDRGHMAPAADMKWDEQAMNECFYLSNMVPQVGRGMNQGIWMVLEKKVRDWAISRGEIYIYTGPVYRAPENTKTIGRDRVAIPSALFKIVFDPAAGKAIAFLMPNQSLDTKDMPLYLVSVREVEKETGLDFFNNLSQEAQDTLETGVEADLWH